MFDSFDEDASPGRADNAPGKVRFDDRGNAIYEWNDKLAADNQQAEQLRERALINPTLSLVDDAREQDTQVRNDKGLRVGYNPYQSGQLSGKSRTKKHDIRELSKWIEQQRRLGLLPAARLKKSP